MGRDAVKAKAAAVAAVATFWRSLEFIEELWAADRDSNCKRGCLKIKLLGFDEMSVLPPAQPLEDAWLAKFENTFVVEANGNGLAISTELSLEVLEAMRGKKIKINI